MILIDLGLAKIEKEINSTCKVPFSLIYSPPEQVLNHNELVNASSDIYALGITLYELLTNEKPFESSHPEAIMRLQISSALPENRKIPTELFSILNKATAKHHFKLPPNKYHSEEIKKLLKSGQDARYQYVDGFRSDLIAFQNNYIKPKKLFWKFWK